MNRKLVKAYTKRLKRLNKTFFTDRDIGLVLFVEYLKYLRDCFITGSFEEGSERTKTKIATIVAAIAEFDTYKDSQSDTQKVFHWNNFCELVKLNMEEWLESNDSV